MGFETFKLELSTRPEKSIGSEEVWKEAEDALEKVLDSSNLQWKLNLGDGASYGPKIDCHLVDSLDRSWQCGTIQLDFSMPERFGLKYIDSDNEAQTPVMIHLAILGSFERFMGIMIEHYAGGFPMWLAPVQCILLPVAEGNLGFCEEVAAGLKEKGFRTEIDHRSERLNFKIRSAQLAQIPYMLIIGDKEVDEKKIAPRKVNGDQFPPQSVSDFLNYLETNKVLSF